MTDRLRVAQLVTTLARGGAQATVLASADMADLGIDVTVLAGADRSDEGDHWDDPGLDALDVQCVPDLQRSLTPFHDARALWWLRHWLQDSRPDVLHTHSSKAGVLGRLAAAAVGVDCVHTVHGWGPLHDPRRPIRLAARLTERSLAPLASRLVVVGGSDLTQGQSWRIGDAAQYRLIRSGVDLSVGRQARNQRQQIRTELGLGSGFVVGMVARFARQKDHRTLIEGFAGAGLDDATLVLIGDGPSRSDIEDQIRDHGLQDRTRLLGQRDDAARVVAGFDLSVLTTHWEGLPRTVVEAAAAGVPIAATDVGSVSDLVVDGVSGHLLAAGASPRLARIIADLAADPASGRAMVAAADRRLDQFSMDTMRHDLAQLWREVAGAAEGVDDASTSRHPADIISGRR
jgi:glycosyltransferase involved in cell wall biosynthesis